MMPVVHFYHAFSRKQRSSGWHLLQLAHAAVRGQTAADPHSCAWANCSRHWPDDHLLTGSVQNLALANSAFLKHADILLYIDLSFLINNISLIVHFSSVILCMVVLTVCKQLVQTIDCGMYLYMKCFLCFCLIRWLILVATCILYLYSCRCSTASPKACIIIMNIHLYMITYSSWLLTA